MAHVVAGRKEPLACGFARTIELEGVRFRVTMTRHTGTPSASWRKPPVWWTARVESGEGESHSVHYHKPVLASTPVESILSMAGLIVPCRGCKERVAVWHYDAESELCDSCGAEAVGATTETGRAAREGF